MRARIIRAGIFAVIAVIVALAAFRVPYFGEFIDAVIFTYPFG